MSIPSIKNIIFDLGGVLLNIDPLLTLRVFTELGVKDMQKVHETLMRNKLYHRFDSGKCSLDEFREEIITTCGIPLTYAEVDLAWNTLLLDFPASRVKMMHDIRQNYRLYLLSNTNPIHYKSYTETFAANYGEEMPDLFDQLFLSYHLGSHKPELTAYTCALEEGGLDPAETLFIDDLLENAIAATKTGMTAYHLNKGMEVTSLFINKKLRMDAEFLFP